MHFGDVLHYCKLVIPSTHGRGCDICEYAAFLWRGQVVDGSEIL